jgi:hypothetical protein
MAKAFENLAWRSKAEVPEEKNDLLLVRWLVRRVMQR